MVLAPDGTRREQAAEAEQRQLRGLAALADAADAAVFGPGDPDEAAIARIWNLADTARRGAVARLKAWRRLWVAVNPASLWGRAASRRGNQRPPMRVKVTLERPAGLVDLVLTADADATVGDVAEALASRDPTR